MLQVKLSTINMSNIKYNSWTVVNILDNRHWVVRCDCGFTAIRIKNDITSGKSKSCRACSYQSKSRRKALREAKSVHGCSNTITQRSWTEMKRRCLSPHRRGYKNYGGRGIKVCDRWLRGDGAKTGFHCFLEDMGERPSLQHQLDRIDNNGNYEPANCRWATRQEQMMNRQRTIKVELNGEQLSIAEAAEKTGLTTAALYTRLRKGLTGADLFKPLRITRRTKQNNPHV